MKVLLILLIIAASVTSCSRPPATTRKAEASPEAAQAVADVAWLTNFEEAKKAAAAGKVPILADFSGSDWCGWCIKLEEEVFSQTEFKAYAKQNLILFLADFPRRKSLPDAVKRQNNTLAEKYAVRGFPTVLLLDSNGTVIARSGYKKGGAEKYIFHIQKLLNK